MWEMFSRLFRGPSPVRVEGLARQVVEASLQEVSRLVAGKIHQMSLAEARGYVRARSAAVVRRQTALALRLQSPATAQLSAAIIPAATERLVPQVLRETGVGSSRRLSPPLAA